MSYMFYNCNSLTKLDLSNFNAQNVINISFIFADCYSLKKENILTNDDKILEKVIYD